MTFCSASEKITKWNVTIPFHVSHSKSSVYMLNANRLKPFSKANVCSSVTKEMTDGMTKAQRRVTENHECYRVTKEIEKLMKTESGRAGNEQ